MRQVLWLEVTPSLPCAAAAVGSKSAELARRIPWLDFFYSFPLMPKSIFTGDQNSSYRLNRRKRIWKWKLNQINVVWFNQIQGLPDVQERGKGGETLNRWICCTFHAACSCVQCLSLVYLVSLLVIGTYSGLPTAARTGDSQSFTPKVKSSFWGEAPLGDGWREKMGKSGMYRFGQS